MFDSESCELVAFFTLRTQYRLESIDSCMIGLITNGMNVDLPVHIVPLDKLASFS